MVDGVRPGQENLRNGNKGISLLQQPLDDGGQSRGGVLGGIVKQHDGAGLHPARHPLCDLAGGQILPVQTVNTTNKSIVPFTSLCYNMNDRDIHS